ncbi:FAD/NAD(P)-binding domain-containing protein [Astrocystis sublimbata]|nr:FAD/NAD(P)-binding domain-containing protein [Astrocystis sublimbata]KAI0198781.1 FAD/NAD(P)-binding domain-containing protein [Astrocystis sublimbata]
MSSLAQDACVSRRVIIVGGSIAGLMCGLLLKHVGCDVEVLEQDGDDRKSHMAGIAMGPNVMDLLRDHDRLTKPFTYEIDGLQSLDTSSKPGRIVATGRREITSWDALYYRLRSNFDGRVSAYYPQPPEADIMDGTAVYHSHTRVLDVGRADASDARLTVTSLDRHTNAVSERKADLVIGADGADSMIRAKYQPAVQRRYAGYVVWRGTVQEAHLSATTLKAVAHSATNHAMDRHHIIVYIIPGKDGSLQAGKRLVNFCWYTNETPESLDDILRDRIDGHRHRNTVPAGRVKESAWEARLKHARAVRLPPALLEIVEQIQEPFIQVISEFFSPRGVFEDGQVLLMGDALTLVRPHAGLSSAKSAFHSRAIEDFVRGKLSVQEWETSVLRYSYRDKLMGVYWGTFYQGSMSQAIISGAHYWAYSAWYRFASWMGSRSS